MDPIDISALPEDLRKTLAQLSALFGKPIQSIAEEAIREFVEWRRLQRLDLERAVQAADAGYFATDDEVERFFKRYDT